MKFQWVRLVLLFAAAAFASSGAAQENGRPGNLPAGHSGIAAQFPGDRGIESHKSVLFVENFNDDLANIKKRWESVQDEKNLSLSSDIPAGSTGNSSLLMTHTGGRGTGSHLYRRLQPGYDKLHYPFYVKFDENCYPIHHFFHVGGYHPATSWPQGGAGERPAGHERFTTGIEPHGRNRQWDYYSYWMEMRGSPPRGQTWGNSFIHDPATKVTRGKWQCLELMMKLNDVGESNGEMALWLDGKLVSHLGQGFPKGKWDFVKFKPGEGGDGVRWNDERNGPEYLKFPADGAPFDGFQWRSNEDLRLNFLWVLCYITRSPQGTVSKVWFDDIVVAKEYIGPIQVKE